MIIRKKYLILSYTYLPSLLYYFVKREIERFARYVQNSNDENTLTKAHSKIVIRNLHFYFSHFSGTYGKVTKF